MLIFTRVRDLALSHKREFQDGFSMFTDTQYELAGNPGYREDSGHHKPGQVMDQIFLELEHTIHITTIRLVCVPLSFSEASNCTVRKFESHPQLFHLCRLDEPVYREEQGELKKNNEDLRQYPKPSSGVMNPYPF